MSTFLNKPQFVRFSLGVLLKIEFTIGETSESKQNDTLLSLSLW